MFPATSRGDDYGGALCRTFARTRGGSVHRLMRWKPSPSMVVSLVALFVALTTSAYAVDGPNPGVDTVGSQDIINAEVKQADIGGNAVGSGKVIDESLT